MIPLFPSLHESLSRINPNSKSIVIVGRDSNLGYMDWNFPNVIIGKANLQQPNLCLDIINYHSLTQLVNIPNRQDKSLDLVFYKLPFHSQQIRDRASIGESDNDVVFTQCVTSLRRCHAKTRKGLQFSKANWDQINEDITQPHEKIFHEKDSSTVEQLWNDFKTSLSKPTWKNPKTW